MKHCECGAVHKPRRVVLTGGPGAGKTALLELVRQSLCSHVRILPEAASIIFGGGFPRTEDDVGRRAAQRAIYHVQRELEAAGEHGNPAIVLCDRGTLDGLAYWPGDEREYWKELHTTIEAELARYAAVIHLRTPSVQDGYNHENPLRTESASAAAVIDARIAGIWARHPRRFEVAPSPAFLAKATDALAILRAELPECCRKHLDHAAAGVKG